MSYSYCQLSLMIAKDSGRASYVLFVLTDGQPNVEPALDDLCKSLEWRCTMSTFGFGYGIESPLLRNLAVVTGGNYIFIPDSSFVGLARAHHRRPAGARHHCAAEWRHIARHRR
jgi:hypothetical protein